MAGNAYRASVPGVDLADVQGNILRGYRMPHVRHLVLRVADPTAARAGLGSLVDGTCPTQVTSAARWSRDRTPDDCLNVGITFAGLRALGVPPASLATFPDEFAEGMAARAAKLGDIGPSAPERWDTRLGETQHVHVILTIHAAGPDALDRATRAALPHGAFTEIDRLDGQGLGGGRVHFGYRDGIAQPRFVGVHDPESFPDRQPLVPLGAVLLGHPTPFPGVRWRVPEPAVLGRNGAFNAFRVLAQDVVAFEHFLETAAKEHPWYLNPELVAAKLCGRWRNGVPLQQSPLDPPPRPPRTSSRWTTSTTKTTEPGRCARGERTSGARTPGTRGSSRGAPTTPARSSGAASPTDPSSIPPTLVSGMSRGACSAASSAPASPPSSRRCRRTG